jgi:4-amino-4-deoxy-L-arabinose transferase-like glycosyltransferase
MTAAASGSEHTRNSAVLWRWFSEPQGWLVLLIAAQLIFWTIIPLLFAWSLPLDVVSDGIAWGHEWQWGYYKHPPLPSWLSESFFVALGNLGPFLLSQIAIAATYGLVFLLGRNFMPARWAAAGALLLGGVYYFSVPTPEFNHNVAQMPLWAAASLCYYNAWRSGGVRWWFALGVAAGLGLLAKYATGVLLVAMLAHFISSRGLRSAFTSAGPWLAVVVCIGILAPHLVWLVRSGFPTLHYAVGRAGMAAAPLDRFVAPAKFLLAQAIDIAPAFLAAAIAKLLLPRNPLPVLRDENMRFLLWLTLGPPLLTAGLSLATGLGIRDMWGAPMWSLTGLVIAEAALLCRTNPVWPRLALCVSVLFVLGLLAWLFSNVFVPKLEQKPSRIQWPDQDMSRSFAAIWQHQEHRPVAIVAADGWLGGLAAMGTRPRPSVWIDASFAKSPWITPSRLAQEGALVLWQIRAGTRPSPLSRLPGLQNVGVKSFAWPATPKAPPLRIGYGIIPPHARDNNS